MKITLIKWNKFGTLKTDGAAKYGFDCKRLQSLVECNYIYLNDPSLTSYLVRSIALRRLVPRWQPRTVYDIKVERVKSILSLLRELQHNLIFSITIVIKHFCARFSAHKLRVSIDVATFKVVVAVHIVHHIQTALTHIERVVDGFLIFDIASRISSPQNKVLRYLKFIHFSFIL